MDIWYWTVAALTIACCVLLQTIYGNLSADAAVPICNDWRTYYKVRKDGRAMCRSCPTCEGGGIGWNESFVRNVNENGYTNCYPCVRCPRGTYRTLDESDSRCLNCSGKGMECWKLQRYESVDCGGASKGHCGDCLPGFIASSSASNSPCTKDPKVTKGPLVPEENLREVLTADTSKQQVNNDGVGVKILYISVAGIVLLTVVCVVAVSIRCPPSTRATKHTQNTPNHISSMKRLLESNGSNMCAENDIEYDGERTNMVRGELPTVFTEVEMAGLCSEATNRKSCKWKMKRSLPYENRTLEISDETIRVVANNVYGERRYELFSYLGLDEPKTKPEEERWLKEQIKFADYILEVLKVWLQIYANKADLKWLLTALKQASYDQVVERVLELKENTISNSRADKGLNSFSNITIIETQSDASDANLFSLDTEIQKEPKSLYLLALLALYKTHFQVHF